MNTNQYSSFCKSELVIKVLKILQEKASTQYLISLLQNINPGHSVNELSIELYSIYIDMIHLTGNYRKAVGLICNYLGRNNEEQVTTNEIANLKIREIHHRMFYEPVDPLIKKMLSLLKEYNQTYPEIYREMLFMLGGNLGVLSGDDTFSRKWLVNTIRESNQNTDNKNLCRSLRKYAQILNKNNHQRFALKTCNIAIDISERNGMDRFNLYLLTTKADVLRKMGNIEEAESLAKDCLSQSFDLGIKGWIAHIYLLLAIIEMSKEIKNNETFSDYLRKAEYIYIEINQQWGIAHINIINCLILLNGNNTKSKIDKSIKEALKVTKKFNYKYETYILQELLKRKKVIYSLNFL
jgi:hypothetical protein